VIGLDVCLGKVTQREVAEMLAFVESDEI